ncbi:Type I restriction modification DNA specificity domain-containing protein [Colwellia chukchiensis]|uniref:Type I restriction modification DNA specificity domain-containing protein n=1 Tax=Colwellia chukchiensis TaxID=641665 RepID=A0A1H7U061_9GAMM|nr:restriction endonuclease subunit S [Colwellia chukchiensis]SEL90046.1 Type I restriction modification DNA specificity domain-containing protein [Colwellia chukchiensis]
MMKFLNSSTCWKEFSVSELFELKKGESLTKKEMIEGNTPYIGASERNNGLTHFVGQAPNRKGGEITINRTGSVAHCSYQEVDYFASENIFSLKPNFEINLNIGIFICVILNQAKYKYSYGRTLNTQRILDIKLPLPVDINENISFEEINLFMNQLKDPSTDINKIKRSLISNNVIELPPTSEWKEFLLSELFEVSGTKTTPKKKLLEIGQGIIPYISTKGTNNGVDGYYDIATEKGNVITVDSATVGSSFFQESDFSASDHVEKLTPIGFELNKFNAQFILTILKQEQFRYGYGRKFNQKRIANTMLKLPIDANGNPNWQLMEDYIKSLPYSASI